MNPSSLEALGVIEGKSLACGLKAIDACIKKATLQKHSIQMVSPGKFVLWIGGTVADVEESYREGLSIVDQQLISSSIIMDVHPRLVEATGALASAEGIFNGMVRVDDEAAIGMFEWEEVCSAFLTIDQTLKRMRVSLDFLRLAKGIGGRTLALFHGDLAEIEAAYDYARQEAKALSDAQIIARPDPVWVSSAKIWLAGSHT